MPIGPLAMASFFFYSLMFIDFFTPLNDLQFAKEWKINETEKKHEELHSTDKIQQ